MKKTFKYIFAVTALSTAFLASAFSVAAQTLAEGEYEWKNGIAYRKTSTLKQGSTDTYIVNLEAFVTGGVTMKQESVPADIVLVLDVSGSMDEYMYYSRDSQAYSYNSYGENTYYYLYNGEYYEVERYSSNRRYGLRFYVSGNWGGTWHYIYGNGLQTTDWNTARQNNANNTVYTGVLYEQGEQKITALKNAVGVFIDEIRHNDLYDEDGNRRKGKSGADTTLGNQIAIVKFAMNYYYNHDTGRTSQGYNIDNAPLIEGDDSYRYSSQVPNANYTQVVRGFKKTGTQESVNDLKAAVNGLHAAGATAADYGMNLARLLVANLGADREGSSKTVVFFTDGSPTYSNGFDDNVASYTISNAYALKSSKATVFSVGVFSGLSAADEERVNNYMSYTSSNYPNAQAYNRPGQPISTDPEELVYYQNASNADLSDVFKVIAQSSGGSGNTEVGGDSAVTVDVVASSFHLPEGVTKDSITVTVAPCTGQAKDPVDIGDEKKHYYYNFGPAKEATEYGLDAVTPEVDPANNMVSTKGFDFSANWCGFDESMLPDGAWRGYKQIISFEIKVNETAVGGPNVPTNDEKSGIYVNGKPVAIFNRPEVRIPISIWIKKKGLLDEDSAVFTVEYVKYEKGKNPRDITDGWKSFTKVQINNVNNPKDPDGYPVVKLVGLDPDFFYRIREDAWAWTYDFVAGGIHYTGETPDEHNPFVFENTPKTNIGKEAEATVQNAFDEKSTSSTSK